MTSNQNHIERLTEEDSFRFAFRYYVERLAFTQRGRFAFLAFLLLVNRFQINAIQMHGITSASWTPTADPTLVQTMLTGVGGGLSVLVAVLGGMVVLLLIDIYEDEFGVMIDE